MKYFQERIEFNFYPCETSKEVIKLIKRKKYNKIILISNVEKNLSGKKFVEDARKIIGSNIIS